MPRWAARSARCWRWRKPARSARSSPSPPSPTPAKPFRFLAGDPSTGGPFGILQPKQSAPPVEPDLILVPLIAVDGRGTRLGRGKGHYDRVLAPLKRKGARLIGVGWRLQRLDDGNPARSVGRPDGRLRLPRAGRVVHKIRIPLRSWPQRR